VGAVELLEDALALTGGNPDALIAHGQAHRVVIGLTQLDLDAPAVGAVLDGVIHQVRNDLLEAERVNAGHQLLWRP
jgi:hypothetical protein